MGLISIRRSALRAVKEELLVGFTVTANSQDKLVQNVERTRNVNNQDIDLIAKIVTILSIVGMIFWLAFLYAVIKGIV